MNTQELLTTGACTNRPLPIRIISAYEVRDQGLHRCTERKYASRLRRQRVSHVVSVQLLPDFHECPEARLSTFTAALTVLDRNIDQAAHVWLLVSVLWYCQGAESQTGESIHTSVRVHVKLQYRGRLCMQLCVLQKRSRSGVEHC